MLRRHPDLDPADWVRTIPYRPPHDSDGTLPFHYLGGCVPDGFACYAKLLHPIYRDPAAPEGITWADYFGNDTRSFMSPPEPEGVPVRWEAVARDFGVPYDVRITETRLHERFPKASWPRNLCSPAIGTLDVPTLEALIRHLGESRIPCFFYYEAIATQEVWKGDVLFSGELRDVVASIDLPNALYGSPTWWWPADRRWCVFTSIDLSWSYLGCSRSVLDALMTDERLELFEADRNLRNF